MYGAVREHRATASPLYKTLSPPCSQSWQLFIKIKDWLLYVVSSFSLKNILSGPDEAKWSRTLPFSLLLPTQFLTYIYSRFFYPNSNLWMLQIPFHYKAVLSSALNIFDYKRAQAKQKMFGIIAAFHDHRKEMPSCQNLILSDVTISVSLVFF